MRRADPLALPLTDTVLVEASAGTGKTTALVNVYLRALLLEGLDVREILAVTYTEAATAELAEKIRRRLRQARKALDEDTHDEFLKRLLEAARAAEAPVAERIEAAWHGLDEAAIFTIHGFCRRALADHAFEAGMPFALEVASDESELRATVAADFWRRRMAAANPAYASWLIATFKTPEGLLKRLKEALQISGGLRIEPRMTSDDVRRVEEEFDATVARAIEEWNTSRERLTKFLAEGPGVNRQTYNGKAVPKLIEQWERWVSAPVLSNLPEKFELLTIGTLSKKMNKGHAPPDEPFFTAAQRLSDGIQELSGAWWRETFAAAFHWMRDESARRKRAARLLGYNDMLQRLADALRSPDGGMLAARIAGRYRLALIDEFQDTDPLQYKIFMRIYEGRRGNGLILIGDPKQAIYKFRGADVFTYMRARRACEKKQRIARLGRNYRSTPGLVETVNALFGNIAEPFVYGDIPFEPVEAAAASKPLTIDGRRAPPLTVFRFAAPADAKGGILTKVDAAAEVTEACAAEIARLIALGGKGQARCGDDPVHAKDIAVLVRSHRQGEAIKRALTRRGVGAVMLSRESVFASAEAEDLQALLAAVAEPGRADLLRHAFATPLLGRTASDLARFDEDEDAWAGSVEAFREYRRLWQDQGFTPMLFRLLREEGVIERTLARGDGARAMTNLRHLAELADAESARRPGVEPLLVWLARERRDARAGDEARELRLESDEELVRIVTIHKAKGLEYPIVFLPFLWYGKEPSFKEDKAAVLAHDEDYEPVLDLGSPALDERIKAAKKEAVAEEARLAYVAITRAKSACYAALGPVSGVEHSAIARLLETNESGEFEAAFDRFVKANADVVSVVPIRAGAKAEILEAPPAPARGEARAFRHRERLRQRFFVASYTALAAGAETAVAESPDWDETAQAPAAGAGEGIHAFPAGAVTGRFWHALIEGLPFDAGAGDIETAVARGAAAAGFDPRWNETLAQWLAGVFGTPLGEVGFALRDVGQARRVNELEFYFPLAPIDAPRLEAALAKNKRPRPPLDFKAMQGLMKGYVDLVFEHGGRYWIADYKSNRLGAAASAYTQAALDAAMAEHRYDLQYLIYTVAVHRFLAARLEGYDYERHFGGVFYLFLRGMGPSAPPPRGVWFARPTLAEIRRLETLLAGAADV